MRREFEPESERERRESRLMPKGISLYADERGETVSQTIVRRERSITRMASKQKPIAEIKDGAVYVLQAGTPIFVKTADICSIIGKSNQWVGQLTSQGTLNKQSTVCGSLYNLSDNLRDYITMIEERTDEKDGENASIERDRRKYEAKLKKAKAQIASLEASERTGQTHRSTDVADMTADLVFAVRGALLALPGRLAVAVVNAKDAADTAEIIRSEVYKVMEELSQYKYDPAKYEEKVRERIKSEALASTTDDQE